MTENITELHEHVADNLLTEVANQKLRNMTHRDLCIKENGIIPWIQEKLNIQQSTLSIMWHIGAKCLE